MRRHHLVEISATFGPATFGRPRRRYSVETSRCDAAAATWMFRGGVAATTRPRRGYSAAGDRRPRPRRRPVREPATRRRRPAVAALRVARDGVGAAAVHRGAARRRRKNVRQAPRRRARGGAAAAGRASQSRGARRGGGLGVAQLRVPRLALQGRPRERAAPVRDAAPAAEAVLDGTLRLVTSRRFVHHRRRLPSSRATTTKCVSSGLGGPEVESARSKARR